MIKMKNPVIVWFRQDLRLQDNEALNAAIELEQPIIPLYIYEEEIKEDRQLTWEMGDAGKFWLEKSLVSLAKELKKLSLNLIIRKGNPFNILSDLIDEVEADTLFWNRCYEPLRIKDDSFIKAEFSSKNFKVQSFNGSLMFEPWEINTKQNKPFQVFTPFFNACMKNEIPKVVSLPNKKIEGYQKQIFSERFVNLKFLQEVKGFDKIWKPGAVNGQKILDEFLKEAITFYDETRDRPDLDAVSHLSPYLHFGELSPRMIWHEVHLKCDIENSGVTTFLRQLFWREFAYHLLYHFPKTEKEPLRKKFTDFPWKNEGNQLKAWQKGMTGYPLVDAGMRQLLATGWMHNRVRMVVGSFLVKDLLISWQDGAKWFYKMLVDADLANNTLGWQWVAGCGADAAPYFRIFNPTTQAEKFDPDGSYIRKWVPEISQLGNKWIHKPFSAPVDVLRRAGIELGLSYPKPIVDHDVARKEALEALKSIGD